MKQINPSNNDHITKILSDSAKVTHRFEDAL